MKCRGTCVGCWVWGVSVCLTEKSDSLLNRYGGRVLADMKVKEGEIWFGKYWRLQKTVLLDPLASKTLT